MKDWVANMKKVLKLSAFELCLRMGSRSNTFIRRSKRLGHLCVMVSNGFNVF